MADEAAAPAANPVFTPVAAPSGDVSANDAVAFLRERRTAPQTREPATPEPAGAAEPESTSQEEDAGPAEAPGEIEANDEAGEPPIQPPRTWTKAEKEAFATLPREHQQSIVDRESERDSYYQRGLKEAAETKQAAQAERQAAEQARQQYERALPDLLQQFQGQFAAEFQDIKTWDDVRAMRETDPMRFMAWQEAREKGTTLQREAQAAQQRQQQEASQQWQKFIAEQDAAFLEKAPEFRDQKKFAAAQAETRAMFSEYGISSEEVSAWGSGRPIYPNDHRWQLIVRDAVRYRSAQKALKAAQPKPVPPVQRPGTAVSRGEATTGHIRDLANQLKAKPNSTDAAVALLRAKRNASARAS